MMARRMIGRLRDDGRMVDGSGGWEVDNRSPENREVRKIGEKVEQRVICQTNSSDVRGQKKEGNKGFPTDQQSRELVKKWVRYDENKK